MIFRDRKEAGQYLAGQLQQYSGDNDAIVLALPRGGVPVAYEVARSLHVPMDVFLVRKLGVPGHEELAMGAVASGGVRVLSEETIRNLGISQTDIEAVTGRELKELSRREASFRGDLPMPDLKRKTVILIDDGLATGSTMRAAAAAVRNLGAKKIIVAVPVASEQTCDEFRSHVDDIVCAATPEPFFAVGRWYEDFSQTTDEEVHELLLAAARDLPRAA